MAKIYKRRNNVLNNILDNLGRMTMVGGEVVQAPRIEETQARNKVTTGALTSVVKPIINAASNQMFVAGEVVPVNTPIRPTPTSTQTKPVEPVRPTNFEDEMEDGQWYAAIVDNTNVHSGTKLNDYGYLTVHCDDAQDGEYVHVNSKGEVQLIEQRDISEDYRAQIEEFKLEHAQARDAYEPYRQLQELAKQGYENTTNDLDDPHQVNSIMDLLINLGNELTTNVQRKLGLQDGPVEWRIDDDFYDYMQLRVLGRKYINNTVGKDALKQLDIESWDQLQDVESIKDFLALDIDEDAKAYFAYQAVGGEQAEGTSWEFWLNDILTELAEDGDWASQAIKGALWAEDDEKLSWAQSTHSETGRKVYQFNTGDIFVDMLLEAAHDPGVWLTVIQSFGVTAAAKGALKGVAKEVGSEFAEQATKQFTRTVSEGLSKGLASSDIAVKALSGLDIVDDNIIKTLTDALDYGRASKLARSLGTANNVYQKADDAFMFLSKVGGELFPLSFATKAVKQIASIPAVSKAAADAFSTITSGGKKSLDIFNVKRWVDKTNHYILGLNAVDGTVLPGLPASFRRKAVVEANMKFVDRITEQLIDRGGILSLDTMLYLESSGTISTIDEYYKYIEALADELEIDFQEMSIPITRLKNAYDSIQVNRERIFSESIVKDFNAIVQVIDHITNLPSSDADPKKVLNLIHYIRETYKSIGTAVASKEDHAVLTQILDNTSPDDVEALATVKNILAEYIKEYNARAHYNVSKTNYVLPNRSVVSATQEILAHASDPSQLKNYVGNAGHISEATVLSEVNGKVYQGMVSKTAMADLEAADVELSRMYNNIINREPGMGQLISNAAQESSKSAAHHVVERAYATAHYMNIKHALKKSNVPKELQEGLVDALYSLNSSFKNALNVKAHQSELDLVDVSRRLTKQSYEHAVKYYNQSHVGTCNKFLELACNTPDTAENVKHIAEQYTKYNTDPTHTPVYYSVKLRGDMGGVEEISFMTPDGVVRTLKNNVEGGIPSHQKFYMEVRACMDEIKKSENVRASHKPVQYVGFNNHSSGYDTDYLLGRQFRLYSTGLGLYDTIDVADLKRIELGMPVITEDIFDDYATILHTELTKSLSERIVYPNLKPAFTPIQDDVVIDSMLTDFVEANKDTAIAQALDAVSIRLKTVHKSIGELNGMYKDLGNMFSYNEADIIAALRNLPENQQGLVITVKRVYDSKVVRKFFADSNDPELAGVLFELADAANNNLKNLQNYQLVNTFTHAELNKRIAYMLNFHTFNYTLSDSMTKPQKVALLTTLCDLPVPGGKKKPVWLTSPRTALEVALAKPHKMLFANGLKFANFYESVHSVVDDANAKINQANTTLHGVEQAIQSLEKFTSYTEARELALQQAGLTDSLKYAKYVQQKEVTGPFRRFMNNVHETVADANEEMIGFVEHWRRRYPYANPQLEQRAAYVGEMDKVELAHDLGKHVNEITDEMATMEVLSGVDKFNGCMYAYSRTRDKERLRYVAKLNADDFKAHLIKDCNGRMVIDTTYDAFDINIVDIIAQHLTVDPRIKQAYDGRFLKIWYDATDITDSELKELVDLYKDYALPTIEVRAGMAEGAGYGLNELLDSIEKYSHPSLSYGMYDANTMSKVLYMDNKFFSDCDGLLSVGILNEMGCFNGTYNCMYHGDITILSSDSNNFMSNNTFTNLCSAYTNVLNNMDTVNDMLRFVTRPEANFARYVENLKSLDGVHGARKVAKITKENGYIVGAVTLNNGKYNVVEIDISTPALFQAALKQKSTFVVRYDMFAQLRKAAEFKTIASGNLKQTSTFLRWFNNVRQTYIQSYLFTRYSTWVRNAVDSTAKGVTQEGPSHLQYMIDAHKAIDLFDEIEMDIKRSYHRMNADTISEYFSNNPNAKLTRDEFLILKTYFDNPLSGTQAERLLNQFKIDPYTALKGYADMDLPEEYVRKAIEVMQAVDELDAPHYTKWSMVHAQLAELYGSDIALNLTGLYTRYTQLKNTGSTVSLADIPILGKWFKFNAARFNDVESINRLAVYLNEIDKGHNVGAALKKVSESQFDYTKSDLLKKIEMLAPFTTFKLYNIEFWTNTVFNYEWGRQALKGIADLYESMTDKDDNGYWTEESMSYRAMIDMYLDSLEDDEYVSDYVYEYKGVEADDAFTYGWVSIGDRLYFKAGNSFVDAISAYDINFEENLFQPIQAISTLIELGKLDESELTEYLKDQRNYAVASLIPVIGTLYYSAYSTNRNAKIASEPEDILAVIAPSLFAIQKPTSEYDRYYGSYWAKPVGFDWYNQTEEYRQTHRFVMGVSYIPAYMSKDPATYINTWGRMQQLGLSDDCIQDLFKNSGAWWFTKDGDTYNLHNYKLMIKDVDTWGTVFRTLTQYGWTEDQARELMNKVATPMWYNNKGYSSYSDYTGYGAYSHNMYSGQVNSIFINSKATLNSAKYNLAKYSGSGKWSQYDTLPKTYRQYRLYYRGHDTTRLSKKYQTTYRWHRRTRDIYKDNYAKYGASRMAMEQNLRAYSNRSITEMRRTNQNIRYARIHNRWWAT